MTELNLSNKFYFISTTDKSFYMIYNEKKEFINFYCSDGIITPEEALFEYELYKKHPRLDDLSDLDISDDDKMHILVRFA